LEGVEDSMAVAEGFMGVAVAVTAGVVAVTGAAGTVEGMDVAGTGAAGTVVVRIGGGVTHTRMLTDPTVGKSDKQKNLNRG
jgi:hypothetical protein